MNTNFHLGPGISLEMKSDKILTHYPEVNPIVDYSLCSIVISFKDGDGDIGLSERDTLYPFDINGDYYYNCIINFYKKQNNDFIKLEYSYNFRIPPINPDYFSQYLRGDINIEIDFTPLRIIEFVEKSFKIEIYIYDKALNKSNIIISPEIKFV
jgi:hypothetical protein